MNTATLPFLPPAALRNAGLLEAALQRLERKRGADLELDRSMPLPAVVEALQDERLTAIEVFARACEAYADRPALGERAYALEATPAGQAARYLPAFRSITYLEVWQRTVDLAMGLLRDPRTSLRAGEIAGIYGFGSIDYVITDLACLHAGIASAVLQMGMPAEDLGHLVNEARLASIVVALESLPDVLAVLPDCPSLRSIVVMDAREHVTLEAAQFAQARARTALPMATLQELEETGRSAPPLPPFRPEPGSDPLVTLMYTSGSTGFPKGAMLTQRLWRIHWLLTPFDQLARFPHLGINFYPLSHVLGRNSVLRTFVLGGATSFTLKSDLSTLFEDIRLVRPTFLSLVPRISELIHQAFRAEQQRLQRTGLDPATARDQARAALGATFLGDRLAAVLVGSAPTSPDVLAFLTDTFAIPVFEGYGLTESGFIALDGRIANPPVAAYRLTDVPELGYRLSDQPYPRGELRVKTRQGIPGYFRNPEATGALYDEEGFLRTGDIVEERAPGQIAWVDRKNNVVKLSQGEFVTLWRLESLFSAGSPFLDQVYLYANSQRAYLLGVVVPAWAAVQERLGPAPAPGAVKRLLRAELNRIASEARLRAFEVPRDVLVEEARWTRANGYLTGINKPARPQLKRRYGERLEARYAELEAAQEQALAAPEGASLAEKVRRAVAGVLGLTEVDLAAGSFRDLGGDSLAALSLASLLEEVCGRPVPVPVILNPGSPLQALVDYLEGEPRAEGELFAALHGRAPDRIRAEDLRLERCLDPAELETAAAVARQPLPPTVRTVLLTGSNGFLGHVLCLAWLERMAQTGGKVFALVRAEDDAAAAERMAAAYRTGDPALEQRYASLAGHLQVLAGDFAVPGLGLPAEAYERLVEKVDLIVHAGALVNHVFSYEQLFGPNVLGTLNLIRLALRGRRKRLDYISTIGVLAGAPDPSQVREGDGVAGLPSVWPVEGGYAHGYATSKWACEVLLEDLHGRFRTPVRVFRPSMILPHRRYRGQANAADLLSRLLASLVQTGLAPRSFYAGTQGRQAHYDGLPVDFIAASLVALSSAHQEDAATYQVTNANWEDGVSLDTLVTWMASAGYALERVDDYEAWYGAFSARLQALPAEVRQHSALPILHQWAQPAQVSPRLDASRFEAQVRLCQPGHETEIPHLSEAFIHKYLADLRSLGRISD